MRHTSPLKPTALPAASTASAQALPNNATVRGANRRLMEAAFTSGCAAPCDANPEWARQVRGSRFPRPPPPPCQPPQRPPPLPHPPPPPPPPPAPPPPSPPPLPS